MVFYGLGIIASIISLSSHWMKKSRSLTLTFFLVALFFISLGFLQGNASIVRRFAHLIFFIAPFALSVLSIGILIHTFIRLTKRGWSRKYVVLLLASLLMLGMIGLVFLNRIWWKLEFFYILSLLLDYFFLYIVMTFILFLLLVFIKGLLKPTLAKDYIIVLGMGLLPDGSFRCLLKFRLDTALHFYQRQASENELPAKIIVSGGNGSDSRTQSEAAVMRDYLIQQGVDSDNILVESESINTHQNFLFSKRMMEEGDANRGTIFITNNFHVFRSGWYARQAGIKAEGIGAKTPFYYLPYALFREYLALFLIFRYAHIIAAGLFLTLSFIYFR